MAKFLVKNGVLQAIPLDKEGVIFSDFYNFFYVNFKLFKFFKKVIEKIESDKDLDVSFEEDSIYKDVLSILIDKNMVYFSDSLKGALDLSPLSCEDTFGEKLNLFVLGDDETSLMLKNEGIKKCDKFDFVLFPLEYVNFSIFNKAHPLWNLLKEKEIKEGLFFIPFDGKYRFIFRFTFAGDVVATLSSFLMRYVSCHKRGEDLLHLFRRMAKFERSLYLRDPLYLPQQMLKVLKNILKEPNSENVVYIYDLHFSLLEKISLVEFAPVWMSDPLKFQGILMGGNLRKKGRAVHHIFGILKNVKVEYEDKFVRAIATLCNTKVLGGEGAYQGASGFAFSQEKAKQSALGEALERYCASFSKPFLKLKNGNILPLYTPPKRLSPRVRKKAYIPFQGHPFSTWQYKNPSFPYSPFNKGSYLSWTLASSLEAPMENSLDYISFLREKNFKSLEDVVLAYPHFYLVPSAFIFMPYVESKGEDVVIFNTSSGLACESNIEGALVKAILEAIEKDLIVRFWIEAFPKVRLNVRQIPKAEGEEYFFFDLSPFEGVFCILGFLVKKMKRRTYFSCGSACSFTFDEALEKTYLEIWQNIRWLTSVDGKEILNEINIEKYPHHLLFYNHPHNLEKALNFIYKVTDEVTDNIPSSCFLESNLLPFLLEKLKGKPVYYSILTPKEVAELGYWVVRVLISGFTYPAPAYGEDLIGVLNAKNPLPHPFP